jgi:secreted trypsin-like serine protease
MKSPVLNSLKALVCILIGQLSVQSSFAQAVLGGEPALQGQYPWMTEIFFFEHEHLCGATLIDPHWVLTAGHCAFAFGEDDFLMVANTPSYDFDNPLNAGEILYADDLIYHPLYTGDTGPDLALFHLSSPALASPVSLITPSDLVDLSTGAPAIVMGWGVNDTDQLEASDTLLYTDVLLFDFDTCQTMYQDDPNDLFGINGTENLICAGYFEGESPQGTANGDSGGPLLLDVNGELKQIGVVYGGLGNFVLSDHPGIFTTISGNLDWIQETIDNYDSPSGIADLNNQNSIKAYMSDASSIELFLSQNASTYFWTCEIFDAMGRKLKEEAIEVGTGSETIKAPFASACYVLRLQSERGDVLNLRVIAPE